MDKIKGWRTLLVSIATVILGFAEGLNWTDILGDSSAGWALVIVGAINAALRFVTNTPVLQAKPKLD